jgi:hypothetical protein
LSLSSANPSQLLRGSQAGTGSLCNQLTLHLRKTCHHVKEEASRRRLCTDAVGQTDEMNLSPLGWDHINLTGDYSWHTNNRVAKG